MQEIKEYCKQKKVELANHIKENNLNLSLAIFQVGDNPASNRYVRNKIKDCESVGIKCELYKYTEDISEEDLIIDITLANNRENLTGIMVQLPLPKHINENVIMDMIDPEKDVDGFSKLSKVNPATPQGIITYLEDQNYDFVNKNAVVIGRSSIIGRPIARMLLDRSANVTIIHSKTDEYQKRQYLRNADLVVVATGHRDTITNADLIWNDYDVNGSYYQVENEDCLIADVGINFTEEGKMVGDCENVTVCEKTPVPGGVGLLTRLAVIENLIKLGE